MWRRPSGGPNIYQILQQHKRNKHSRDEKSTRDSSIGFKQPTGSEDHKNIREKGGLHNPKVPLMDVDVALSSKHSHIKETPHIVGDSVLPALTGVATERMETMESQLLSMPGELAAEQLAEMIEQLADEQLLLAASNNGYTPPPYNPPGSPDALGNQAFSIKATAERPTAMRAEPRQSVNTGFAIPESREKDTTIYDLGFDPSGIQPESGFKPMVHGKVQSMPSLAFSVLDSLPDKTLDRQKQVVGTRDMNGPMSPLASNISPTTSSQQSPNRMLSKKGLPSTFLHRRPTVSIFNS